MKTNKYLLLPFVLFLTSCYIYKPYTEKEVEEVAQSQETSSQVKSIRTEKSSDAAAKKVREQQGIPQNSTEDLEALTNKKNEKEQQQQESEQTSNSGFSRSDGTSDDKAQRNTNKVKSMNAGDSKSKELGIKGKLEANKYYKITALGNQYKIQVDKWEGDTLVSHKIRKPEKQFKFHQNDIEEETILERRFSKPFSDLLTVGAYASGAAIVLLLIL